MLKIVVADRSAEGRTKLLARIEGALTRLSSQIDFLPRIDLKPITPEEIGLHGGADICIVGEELVLNEVTCIAAVRKQLPKAGIIGCIPDRLDPLGSVEHLARLGADDVLLNDTTAEELLRKIVLLSRRHAAKKSGKLILVDAGKGGVGATSVVAGLGEAMLEGGHRVALLDLDVATQDLSRFLQARPFVNESLQLLLEGSRPFGGDLVEECTVRVWHDEEALVCVPPPPDNDRTAPLDVAHQRAFLSLLEALDERYDVVLVDLAGVRGPLLKTLSRVADEALVVVSNDPASLYASVDRIQRLRGLLSAGARLTIIENALCPGGISSSLLADELRAAARLQDDDRFAGSIPFCRHAMRWPGSGGTLYSQGGKAVRRQLGAIAATLGYGAEAKAPATESLPEPRRAAEAITAISRRIGSVIRRSGTLLPQRSTRVGGLVRASQTPLHTPETPPLYLEMTERLLGPGAEESAVISPATIS